MLEIIFNEWKGWFRTNQLRWIILLLSFLMIAVSYFSIVDVKNRQAKTQKSRLEVREQWENMGQSNPHGAAHFGSYAFKPITALSSFDEGVNHTAGRVLRLEGHVQNEVVHSSQSQAIFMSYFGPIKASTILQIVLPLFIIFLTFYTIKGEQEQGRLKLLLVQGLSQGRLLFGKVTAVWFLGVLFLFITLLVQWISIGNSLKADSLLRSLLLIVAYASFYWIIAALTAYFCSKWSKDSTALSVMLAVWVLWLVFLPKVSGWIVEEQNPLPSRQEFISAMREDRSKGLDGHNPTDEREEVLKDSVLALYGVESVDSLPVNYDGFVMQADEEYGNKVWDKHFGALFLVMQDQKQSMQLAGLINPFSSLQSLSMGICGTDQWSNLHFQREAEEYRRVFIKALNDAHAFGGSRTGDWSWKAEQEFFNGIDDFHYETPAFAASAPVYLFDWVSMGIWLLISIMALRSTSRNSKEARL